MTETTQLEDHISEVTRGLQASLLANGKVPDFSWHISPAVVDGIPFGTISTLANSRHNVDVQRLQSGGLLLTADVEDGDVTKLESLIDRHAKLANFPVALYAG